MNLRNRFTFFIRTNHYQYFKSAISLCIFVSMNGKIYINGPIGSYEEDGLYAEGVELIDVIAQVKKQPEATSFDVVINSEGGNVFTGFDIYDYLISLGVPIKTIGTGVVASIATVPFMAGTTRQVTPGTKFMIHLPWGTWRGTAEEMQDFTDAIKKTESRVVDFYMNTLSLSKEAVIPLLRNETWLTENQLKDLGFINTELSAISAKLSIQKKDNKMENTKSETLLEKILDALNMGTKKEDAIVAKTLFDANQKEVIFENVGEEEDVTLEETATINGEAPNGEIVMADGRTFIFEAGVLKSIIEVEKEGDAEILKLEEELAAKVKEIETLQSKNDEINAKLEDERKENKTNKAILAKIKAVKSEFEVDNTKDKKDGKTDPKASRFKRAISAQKK